MMANKASMPIISNKSSISCLGTTSKRFITLRKKESLKRRAKVEADSFLNEMMDIYENKKVKK